MEIDGFGPKDWTLKPICPKNKCPDFAKVKIHTSHVCWIPWTCLRWGPWINIWNSWFHNSQWYLIFSRDPCARVVILFISMISWEVLYDSARVSGHLCIVKMCLSHSQSHWTSSADIWQYLTGYIIRRSFNQNGWWWMIFPYCVIFFNLSVADASVFAEYLLPLDLSARGRWHNS